MLKFIRCVKQEYKTNADLAMLIQNMWPYFARKVGHIRQPWLPRGHLHLQLHFFPFMTAIWWLLLHDHCPIRLPLEKQAWQVDQESFTSKFSTRNYYLTEKQDTTTKPLVPNKLGFCPNPNKLLLDRETRYIRQKKPPIFTFIEECSASDILKLRKK
jgi:hypothetical protein